MGWFSKKDDAKKDEPKRAADVPASAPAAPAQVAVAPRPAAPTPKSAAAPGQSPMVAAAPPQKTAAAQTGAPSTSGIPASPGGAVQPDTDPTRTFAALMRVALLAPQTQRLSVQQLRRLVEPAIATGQFVVAANSQASAAVMWASVSDEIDARARTDLEKPFDIGPDDWRSGAHAWIMAVMGDMATARSLIDMIGKGPLKGAPLHARMTTQAGAPAVATFSIDSPPAA